MSLKTRILTPDLWDLAPVAMVAINPAMHVVGWNRAAEQLFGYTAAEVMGRPYPLVPPEQRAAFAQALAATLGGEAGPPTAEQAPNERLHKSGRRLQVRIATARGGSNTAPLCIKSFIDCGPVPAPLPTAVPTPIQDRPSDAREYFRAFMDNTPLAAWVVDTAGRIVLANPAYSWLTGRSPADVLGKTADDLFPPEQAAEYRARDDLVRRTGQAHEWGWSFRRSDGTRGESLIIKFPIPSPAAQSAKSPVKPTLIGAIALDLTEHNLLREQIHQQAQLISHGPQAVVTVDTKHCVRTWNAGAELAFGYSTDQALGMAITDLLHPAPPEKPELLLKLLLASDGKPSEVWLRRKSGESFFASILCRPLHDSEGRHLGTIAYVQDITERKRIEEALGREQARTQGIVNTAVDVILTISERGIIESANPAVRRLLSYEPEELVGRDVSVIMPASAGPLHNEQLLRYQRTGDRRIIGKSREVSVRTKDGRQIPVQISIGEMQLGDRRVYTGIIHDLTDRKNLEQQFLHSQKMEAVGLLAGGVAHDFNNLLTAINGYSDLLLRSLNPGTSTHNMVQEIHLAGTRAATLTRQLLAFSRKQVLTPVVLNLSRVVADMVKLLGRMVGEDVVLQTALAENMWPCLADPGQLEQVVMNLAVNARDAMPGGGLLTLKTLNMAVAEADSSASLPAGEYACLVVADNGCGMDAATRARLFEPFFTTKEVGRGTGLGLATVYGIIKQSGGYILVDSEPGQGTAFRLFLPRSEVALGLVPMSPPRRDNQLGGEVILLVEDDVSVRTMTHRLLHRGGYVVLAAGSAPEAEQLAAGHPGPVHLLVTDIVMPGHSGIELSSRLRRQRPELAVLYISGYAEGALPSRAALPPGATLLPKPFTSETLLTRVREVLDRANRRRGRRSEPEL